MRLTTKRRRASWALAGLLATLTLAVGCGEPCGGICAKAESCGFTDCEITSCPADSAAEQCLEACFEAATCADVGAAFFGGGAPALDACAVRC